ncbi:MAG TPA: FAD:protein FMN transferase [Thermoanaerobaculia bacterium]|nr:FAD:protein FMN transferase [Thermoanaerobaculia bacterium]
MALPAVVERRVVAMGTWLALRVEAGDRGRALEASEAAVGEVARVESLLSTWREGGPLDRLNRARPGAAVAIGGEAASLVKEIFEWSARTHGAFDPTVLPLVRAWDLRGGGRIPDACEIERALAAVGSHLFVVDMARGEARRLSPDAGIDEGAWGKGYALDCAAAALKKAGAREATIDLGGQILTLGPAEVSVSHPGERARSVISLTIGAASVSTSGNSERGLTVGGRRIGHLLDPHTGQPAPDFGSATVVAPSGFVADILSTAFFVLGPEKGLVLSEKLRKEGFANEVLFLVSSGDRLEAAASEGLSYRLEERQP